MGRGSREREVGMVRRREEDGPRRAAAIEGEENHYCQLRQALEGVGEGVYSNVETDHAEEETSGHPEECGSSRIEEKDDNLGADKKAEELKQKPGAEGASNLCGSSPELSLQCETTVGDSSEDAQRRESNVEVTEAREELAGLVYIDYSQFDEDEEVDGSSYGLGGSTYGLGGRSENSYNLSQAGVSVDTGPLGLTDERYRDALEDFIEKTSLEVTQHAASRRRRRGGSVRRQPSILASLLPRALRPHQRHPRRIRQRRLEHTYEVIASPATKRTRSLLDQ